MVVLLSSDCNMLPQSERAKSIICLTVTTDADATRRRLVVLNPQLTIRFKWAATNDHKNLFFFFLIYFYFFVFVSVLSLSFFLSSSLYLFLTFQLYIALLLSGL